MLFGLMGGIAVDKVVDAKGLSCPMPIVRTKKAMEDLHVRGICLSFIYKTNTKMVV